MGKKSLDLVVLESIRNSFPNFITYTATGREWFRLPYFDNDKIKYHEKTVISFLFLSASCKEAQDMISATATLITDANIVDVRSGVIKEGLDAYLTLIDANPIQNLDALQQLSGVMRQGKWLPKKEIEERLTEMAGENQE